MNDFSLKKLFLVTIVICFVSLKADVFLFLDYYKSPSQLALNKASLNYAKDPSAIDFNPVASFYSPDGLGMEFSYVNSFSDTYVSSFATVYSHNRCHLGLSFSYFNYGDFEDLENGNNYHAGDFEMLFNISRKAIFGIVMGANVKYLYSKIDTYSSSGLAFDLALSKYFFDNKLKSSLCLANTGFQFTKYNDTRENLPTSVQFGLSNKLDKLPLELGVQYNYYFNADDLIALSGQFQLKDNFLLLVGYNFIAKDKKIGTGTKLEKFAGLSFGSVLTIKSFDINLGYVINGELDEEFALGVSYSFSKKRKVKFGRDSRIKNIE